MTCFKKIFFTKVVKSLVSKIPFLTILFIFSEVKANKLKSATVGRREQKRTKTKTQVEDLLASRERFLTLTSKQQSKDTTKHLHSL